MTRAQKQERQEAIEDLVAELTDGDKVYSIVRRVARSGMSRSISFFVIRDGSPQYLTNAFGRALGYRAKDVRGHWALDVSGCGMDMCFHVVDSIQSVLRANGKPKTFHLRSESI